VFSSGCSFSQNTGPGILMGHPEPAITTRWESTGDVLSGNSSVGVELRHGTLILDGTASSPCRLEDNFSGGVWIAMPGGDDGYAPRVRMRGCSVQGNSGAGVEVAGGTWSGTEVDLGTPGYRVCA
jgi:hypothetical protein